MRYPDPEELRELQRRLEEAKKKMDIVLLRNFRVSSTFTAKNYTEMNIVPGHRIGFTQKQAYLTRLGDLHSEGYLTSDEYEQRVSWVDDCQTQEQAEMVFMDLRNAVSFVKVNKPGPAVKKSVNRGLVVISVLMMMVFTVGIIMNVLNDQPVAAGIVSGGLVLMLLWLLRLFRD